MNVNRVQLAAKILAKNRVNAKIKEVAPAIFAALKPFEGKKIVLASGELAASVKKAIEGFCGWKADEKIQIYKNSLGYSFSLNFKSSENYSEFSCIYQESTVYFCDITDGVLSRFYPFEPENFRSDYKIEEITAIQEELEIAQKRLDSVKSKLPAFAQE